MDSTQEESNCLGNINITSDINQLKISDINELCSRERRNSSGSHSSYEDLMIQTPSIMDGVLQECAEQKIASKERFLKRKEEERRRKRRTKREYPQGTHNQIFQGRGAARKNPETRKAYSPESGEESKPLQDDSESSVANGILTETKTDCPQLVSGSTKTECSKSASNEKLHASNSDVRDSTQKVLKTTETQSTKLKKQSQLIKDFETQLKSSQTFSSRARMLTKHKK